MCICHFLRISTIRSFAAKAFFEDGDDGEEDGVMLVGAAINYFSASLCLTTPLNIIWFFNHTEICINL